MSDELVRLRVRVAQLEGILREVGEIVTESMDDQCKLDEIYALVTGIMPQAVNPPTEAHAMRELQVADDDTA